YSTTHEGQFGCLDSLISLESNFTQTGETSRLLDDASVFYVAVLARLRREIRSSILRSVVLGESFQLNVEAENDHESEIEDQFSWLISQKILLHHEQEGKYQIDNDIRLHLKKFLSNVDKEISDLDSNSCSEKNVKTPRYLKDYAKERWESILNFIISQNPFQDARKVGKTIADVLIDSKLVKA
ncbi:MAG: hypothetical protein MHPSP_003118, partial [Paramarteilia canceri]